MMLLAEKLPNIHLKMTSMAGGPSQLAAIALATFSKLNVNKSRQIKYLLHLGIAVQCVARQRTL